MKIFVTLETSIDLVIDLFGKATKKNIEEMIQILEYQVRTSDPSNPQEATDAKMSRAHISHLNRALVSIFFSKEITFISKDLPFFLN